MRRPRPAPRTLTSEDRVNIVTVAERVLDGVSMDEEIGARYLALAVLRYERSLSKMERLLNPRPGAPPPGTP